MGIKRIWHGWTTPENADVYQDLLLNEVIPGIEAKNIPGFRNIEVLRKDFEDEVEFVTMMTFNSLQDLIDFQGKEYEVAYIPDAARKVLQRWDERAAHYDSVETRIYIP